MERDVGHGARAAGPVGQQEGAPGLSLFVLWAEADQMLEKLMPAIAQRFDVRGVHRIRWSPERFSQNAARFYRDPRVASHSRRYLNRQQHGGIFTAVTVADHGTPDVEQTPSKAVQRVMFRKSQLVTALGRGIRGIHLLEAMDVLDDASWELWMLFGVFPEEYLEQHPGPWNGDVEEYRGDVTGAVSWTSLKELFRALNVFVPYVVLRNFERLPDSHEMGIHDDVDLLVDDYQLAIRLLNAKPLHGLVNKGGGRFHVVISDRPIIFDFRFVGDNYFDEHWQRLVLSNRRLHANGVYVPADLDYFETLAYHAFVHKPRVSEEYARRLANMADVNGYEGWTPGRLADAASARQLVGSLVTGKGRRYVEPKDITVYFNYRFVDWRLAWFRRKYAGLRRRTYTRWWPLKGRLLRAIQRVAGTTFKVED